MKTTRYDEQEVNESFYRYSVPALVWTGLLVFFAVAGAMSRDEPTQMATTQMAIVAPAQRLMANETADVPAMVLSTPSESDLAVRDEAVATQEGLDPAGVGLNPKF